MERLKICREPASATMENSAKSATAVKDPVCGMNVEPATAKHKFDHAGKAYYFCCASCLEKFRADPDHYLYSRVRVSACTRHCRLSALRRLPAPRTAAAKIALVPLQLRPAAGYGSARRDRLRLSDVSRSASGQAGRLPALRDGAGAGDAGGRDARGIYLPHASGNCAAGAGQLSDLRHGAGAAHRHRDRRKKIPNCAR